MNDTQNPFAKMDSEEFTLPTVVARTYKFLSLLADAMIEIQEATAQENKTLSVEEHLLKLEKATAKLTSCPALLEQWLEQHAQTQDHQSNQYLPVA